MLSRALVMILGVGIVAAPVFCQPSSLTYHYVEQVLDQHYPHTVFESTTAKGTTLNINRFHETVQLQAKGIHTQRMIVTNKETGQVHHVVRDKASLIVYKQQVDSTRLTPIKTLPIGSEPWVNAPGIQLTSAIRSKDKKTVFYVVHTKQFFAVKMGLEYKGEVDAATYGLPNLNRVSYFQLKPIGFKGLFWSAYILADPDTGVVYYYNAPAKEGGRLTFTYLRQDSEDRMP